MFDNIEGTEYDMMYAIYIGQFAYAGWLVIYYTILVLLIKY